MTHRSASADREEFGVIGWGTMPAHRVQADSAAGRLVRLRMIGAEHRRLPLTAIYRTDRPPGPAGRWLIRRFVEQGERAEAEPGVGSDHAKP
ncbi:hypothetical protein [uncultured Methylobacterium sp.]|uniref:hypothetical protein n=1 Tax=uncultured Methylobacterium sp. TaxID=157278 RepID=UPI0035CC15A2